MAEKKAAKKATKKAPKKAIKKVEEKVIALEEMAASLNKITRARKPR